MTGSVFDPRVFQADVFDAREAAAASLAVPTPRLSLMVGPTTADLHDFAAEAVIGERTKAMPGGDGSLTFTLPAPVAAKHRQQLANGALVRLRANGSPDFGGRVCNDPCGGVLSALRQTVTVECSGLWAWADRYKAFGWVWGDTDTAMWQRNTQKVSGGVLVDLEDQAKFTIDTEGRLYIRAEKDREYEGYASGRLAYWLNGGLDTGCRIVGLDVTYKTNLTGNWELRFQAATDPWAVTGETLSTDVAADAWTDGATDKTQTLDLTTADTCVRCVLYRNDAAAGTPAEKQWVKVTSVTVRCRYSSGTTVDRTVNLSDALTDMATLSGLATVTRGESIGASVDQLAVRPELPKSVRDGLIELTDQHTAEIEAWFDLDDAGADRFNHYLKPAACDWTRNSVWHYGDAAGESATELYRDPELLPDWIRLLHLSSADPASATIPNGTLVDCWYPAVAPTSYEESVLPVTEYAEVKLGASDAALVATRIYNRIAASLWTGTVPIPTTITDTRGRVRSGHEVKPGDRLSVPSRDGATDLYVTEATWDWSSMTGTATVGYPWEAANVGGGRVATAGPSGGGTGGPHGPGGTP